MGFTRQDWSRHYTDGHGFRPLGDEEKTLLIEHAAPPEEGRTLDACCGTGELAVFLASLGYAVDGADFADGALARASTERAETPGVRWLCLDIEHDDLASLAAVRASRPCPQRAGPLPLQRHLSEDDGAVIVAGLAAEAS